MQFVPPVSAVYYLWVQSSTVFAKNFPYTLGLIALGLIAFAPAVPAAAATDPAAGYTSAPRGWYAGTPYAHLMIPVG